VNVLANPHFGTVVSESGTAYTWNENAHEFRLTPWGADSVSDTGGEAFYLRDEESGYFWSPAPLPSRGATPYVTRHGFGYSIFEHAEAGIASELTIYVDLHAAVKFSVLKVRNASGRSRRLRPPDTWSGSSGDLRPKSAMHVITEIDPGAVRSSRATPTTSSSPTGLPFFDVDDAIRTVSGDRTEFLGRNGTLAHPAPWPACTSPTRWERLWTLRRHPGFVRAGPTVRSARSSSGWACWKARLR
jgi:cellobiose phosphorylase